MQSTIKVTGIKETMSELRKLDPELLKQMRKDIKNEPGLVNAVSAIKSRAPSISPLRGMIHNGRTAYAKPRVSTSFRPSVRLDRAKQRSIVTINTTPPKDAIGFQIVDMVGRGNRRGSRKAQGMQKGLGGRPSRFVWAAIEGKEAQLSGAVVNIIDDYSKKANVRLRIK
jgi:hypothetical protein